MTWGPRSSRLAEVGMNYCLHAWTAPTTCYAGEPQQERFITTGRDLQCVYKAVGLPCVCDTYQLLQPSGFTPNSSTRLALTAAIRAPAVPQPTQAVTCSIMPTVRPPVHCAVIYQAHLKYASFLQRHNPSPVYTNPTLTCRLQLASGLRRGGGADSRLVAQV